MFRRLIIIVCLILVACGSPAGAPAPTEGVISIATSAPAVEPPVEPPSTEAIPWDNPYDKSIYDDPNTPLLCPEDGIADGQPVFAPPTPGKLNELSVVVQHGLYVNQKNEVFRMDVTGVDGKAVEEYTANVRVCLDHILLRSITKEYQEKVDSSPALEPFGFNPADLSIEFYPQGYLDPNLPIEKANEILQNTAGKPFDSWLGFLKENKLLTPDEVYKDKVQQDFAIYFVIDPSVANGGRHQYPERYANKISVTVSVQDGSGSVTAGICRGSTVPFYKMTVDKNSNIKTASKSDSQAKNYFYDLGVKGNPSSGGRYRISGAWGYPGWSAGYWDAAPTGSYSQCNP